MNSPLNHCLGSVWIGPVLMRLTQRVDQSIARPGADFDPSLRHHKLAGDMIEMMRMRIAAAVDFAEKSAD